MNELNSHRDYEVGYGRPPKNHQFKKGTSGNPRGRPKTQKLKISNNSLSISGMPNKRFLLEEAYRPVSIREGDKAMKMPLMQALYRSMGLEALKGDRYARILMVNLVDQVERADLEIHSEYMKMMIELKLAGEQDIEQCVAQGKTPPDPIPHPDDIFIDLAEGTAAICGPRTKQEKEEWDLLLSAMNSFQNHVSEASAEFKNARGETSKTDSLNRWKLCQRAYDYMNDNLPKRYRRDLENRCWEDGASLPGSQNQRNWPND